MLFWRFRGLAIAALFIFGGCSPEACSDRRERRLEARVLAVIGESGDRANRAETSLVASGHQAILYLETGLYDADAPGRGRIARILGRIGHPDVIPVLQHLVKNDPDQAVRGVAAKALASVIDSVEAARQP